MQEIVERYFGVDVKFYWRRAVALYSTIFFVIILVTMSMFCVSGMGPFQFAVDGFTYFSRIAYLGEYIRNTLRDIFINGTLGISVYDFRIGIGDDVFNLLWVGALNPIVFLTAPFFSVEHTEQLYWLICILHMYAAGLSFMLFCSCKNGDNVASACGAVAYVFSGFALFYFLKHFHFMTAMIMLPAMLWSLEKIMCGGTSYFFIFFTAASLLINFYFFTMITMILFIYGLVHFFDIYEHDRIKMFCTVFCKCAGSYLLGVMLSAPFFLPVVVKFMNNARGSSEIFLPSGMLLYRLNSILYSILYMFSPGGTWGIGASIIPICLLALVCFMWTRASFARGLKLLFLIFLIASFSPLTTYIFTLGTGALTDKRWSFVFAFILTYILALMFPRLASWQEKDEKICSVATLCYAILILCLHIFKFRSVDLNVLFSIISTFAVILCLHYVKKRWKIAMKRALLSCLVIFFSIANVYFLYFHSPGKLKNTFGDAHKAYLVCQKALSPYSVIGKVGCVDRSTFFRCDTTKLDTWKFFVLADQYDLNSYDSLITNYPSYLLKLENRAAPFLWCARGCDDIASLESLLCVKYFAAERGKEPFVPHGFEKIMENEGYSVFVNPNFLPLGYTYDSYITQQEYEEHTALGRLEAQLQAVALENEPLGFARNVSVMSDVKPVRYRISNLDGVQWEGGELKVNKRNASIEIAFMPSLGTETYLRIQGLNVNNSRRTPIVFSATLAGSGWSKHVTLIQSSDSRYHGSENYLVRLVPENDYQERRLKIIWPYPGTFKLEDIQIYAQPMDDYPEQIEKLREDVLENINVGNDKVSGTISLKKNKILCLSIPYSKGWHAKVDGKAAELLKANSLFMALPLEAGDHKIELEYRVPGFRLGLCFFALGVAILGVMMFIDRRKRRQKAQQAA